jgi:long-chain acyl-CoA synthetase
VFHGITKSNKQTEAYFMKNNIDTVERIFKNAAQQHGEKKALGTRKVLGEEDEVQENGQIFKKVLIDIF